VGVILLLISVFRLAEMRSAFRRLAVTWESVGAVVGALGLIVSIIGLLIPAESLYELLKKNIRLRGCVALVVLLVTSGLLIFVVMALAPEVAPTGTPTPEPATFCNGNFEDDFECWQHGGELHQDVKCDGGQCYAVLGDPSYNCEGGVPLGEAWIGQSFQVPLTVSPTLSLRYRVFSYDLDNLDFFQVSADGEPLFQSGNPEWAESSCDREAWDSGWQSVQFDLSLYKGKSVEVFLRNVNGMYEWWNTWTYVDDVEID